MREVCQMSGVFQQIGELVASVRALHEKIDLRHAAEEKQSELLRAELHAVTSDVRALETKHDGAVTSLAGDVARLREAQRDVRESLQSLREPVAEMAALRGKAVGAALVLGPLGAVVLYAMPLIWRLARRLLEFSLGVSLP